MIDFSFILESVPVMLKAIPVTILMALFSAAIGWFIGLLIALIRIYKVPVISQVCVVFVSFMRGVPMVILLYIAYYAFPILVYSYGVSIGLKLDLNAIPPVAYAVGALILDQAAYSSEILRSAILAVDQGQMEAAYSVGMTRPQAFVRVVFPQAFPIALPNMGGLFLGLVKGTSLAFYVGVYEVTATANLLAMPALNFVEAYVMTTVIYEIISFISNQAFNKLEFNMKKYKLSEA